MTDDLTPQLDAAFLQASAHHDGELDAAAMAAAEADPEVAGIVARLRSLATAISATDAPRPQVRESAISAALAEFDRLQTPATPAVTSHTPAAPPVVVPLWRRPVTQRWLTAAAAVMAVGALGIVVSRGSFGGSDEELASVPSEVDLAATAEAAFDEAAESAGQTRSAAFEADAAESAPAAAAEVAAEVAAEESAEASAAELAVGDAAESATLAPASTGAGVAFSDAATLGELAAELLDEGAVAPTEAVCPDLPAGTLILAAATYERPEGPLAVWVAADPATGSAVALDIATCEIVVTAR